MSENAKSVDQDLLGRLERAKQIQEPLRRRLWAAAVLA